MEVDWIKKLADIYGVESAMIVDRDGLVVAKAGLASDRLAPHSALLVTRLIDQIGLKNIDEWQWAQCETAELTISFTNVYVGILIIVMKKDVNLSMVRLEAGKIRRAMKEKFKGPFIALGRS